MKKNIVIGIIGAVCVCSLAGCGKKKDEATVTVATVTDAQPATMEDAVATASEAGLDELKTIGKISDDGYRVVLTNQTGQDIVSVRIYDSVSGEYCDNLLMDGDVYADGEQRVLYYADADETDTAEAASDEAAADEKLISTGYDIELTLEDESIYVLHGFPFGDIEEGSICVENDVAYIVYDGYSAKEAELAIKEAVKNQEGASTQSKPSAGTSQPEPSAPESPAEPLPAPSVPDAPVVVEPAPSAPSEPDVEQNAEECIGDEGLTY